MAPKKMGAREKRRARERAAGGVEGGLQAGPSQQQQAVVEQPVVAEQQIAPERAGPSEKPIFSFSLPAQTTFAPELEPSFASTLSGFSFSDTAMPLGTAGDDATFATREVADEGLPKEVLQDLLRATRETLAAVETDLMGLKTENANLSNELRLSQENGKETENLLNESEDEVEGLRKQVVDDSEVSAKKDNEILILKRDVDKLHKQLADESKMSEQKNKEIATLKREVDRMNKRHDAEVQISNHNEQNIAIWQGQVSLFEKQLNEQREASAKNVEEIAFLRSEVDQQKQKLKEQESNMSANRDSQQSAIETLERIRIEKKGLQRDYDILVEESDSLEAKVAELEQSLHKAMSASAEDIRRKNSQISEHLATINAREEQLKAAEKKIGDRDLQLREKDEVLRSKDLDYNQLNAEFVDTLKNEGNLIANNKTLTESVDALKKENQQLQATITALKRELGDRNVLAAMLAEAETNSESLVEDITHLEDQNSQLRSRLARIGHKRERSNVEATSRSLEDEVSGIEFLTSPEGDAYSPEVIDTQQQAVDFTKGKDREITDIPSSEFTKLNEANNSSSAVISEQLEESNSGHEKEPPRSIEANVVYIERPSAITYIRHNPITCWFQIEWDLLILLMFFYTKMLFAFPFLPDFRPKNLVVTSDNASIGTTASVTPKAKVGTTTPEIKAVYSSASIGNVANSDVKEASDLAISIESSTTSLATFSAIPVVATDLPGVKAGAAMLTNPELPPVLTTLLYFSLHILLYFFILMCAWNYSSLRSEIDMWRAANEITNGLFSYYYGSNRGRQCYGIFHHIFGEVDFVRRAHFYFHLWSKVNRAFPG